MTAERPRGLRENAPEAPLDPEPTRKAAERARVAAAAPKESESGAEGRKRQSGARAGDRARAVGRWVREAFVENYPIKLAALVLAIAVFILVHSDDDVEISVYVDVAYHVPDEKVLVSEPVDRVRLTVSGSRRRIQQFDERAMERVVVRQEEGQSGEFSFSADMFDVPEGLRVVGVTPPSTSLHFEARDRKEVPIEVTTLGEVAEGHVVESVKPDPPRAEVVGAESELAAVTALQTRDIGLDGRAASFEDTVPLIEPEGNVEVAGDPFVRVAVAIGEEAASRALGTQAIALEPGAGVEDEGAVAGFRADPATAEIELGGAPEELEQIEEGDISVVVEVREGDIRGGQARSAPVEVRGAPDGVAAEASPEEVTLLPP